MVKFEGRYSWSATEITLANQIWEHLAQIWKIQFFAPAKFGVFENILIIALVVGIWLSKTNIRDLWVKIDIPTEFEAFSP